MAADAPGPYLSLTAEELPGPLNDIEEKYAPARLYVAGDRRLLSSGARVSVILSRAATAEGVRNARLITESLVDHGVVVSGLAGGIDTISHETAIRRGGRTIAVLGTPLDVFYPAKNCALQTRIMREHLAISQFALGTGVQRGNFPRRNRTMAGETSGTLHQGGDALRLGRTIFILEPVGDDRALTWVY